MLAAELNCCIMELAVDSMFSKVTECQSEKHLKKKLKTT